MADDLNKRGKADRTRVSTTEQWEANYWCDRFEVTHDQLCEAVREVGPMVADVQRYLEEKFGH